MKKNTTIYTMLLCLWIGMGITGCSEDISMSAAKLPDGEAMNSTAGVLRSARSFINRIPVNLEKEDETAVEEIYYLLSQPAKNNVTVTVAVDERLVETYNFTHNTNLEALPANNVKIEGGGTLSVAAGKQESAPVKVSISTAGLEPATIYLLPLAVEQPPTEATVQTEKQVLYYGINIREQIMEVYPHGQYMPIEIPPMLPDLFLVYYVNTETYQPLLADAYAVNRQNMTTFEDILYNIGDVVNLKTVTVGYDPASKRALLNLSSDMKYVLEHVDKYIRPLQDHGRKVCLCIENGSKGLGFCNMDDAQIADFTRQVKDVIELYRLDGVNLWDEEAGYNKEGIPAMNPTSYPKLIKALREALPGKLLTLVDKGTPTASFYDAGLCGGIEVGKLIDYAWHGYVTEKEVTQIVEPWETNHPYSDYTRKPIAGLSPKRYGNVNRPRYNVPTMLLEEESHKKVATWKKDGNRKKNNILIFGTDLAANEQNQYEGYNKSLIEQIDFFMDDGKYWDGEWKNDKYYYWYANLDWRLDQMYRVYAKDW